MTKEEIELKLNSSITDEKYNEIVNLKYQSLTRVRNNPTGKMFNRLLVLGRAPSELMPNGKPMSKWWCICSCKDKNIISVRINNLTSGNTKSCGCFNNEQKALRMAAVGRTAASDLTNKRFCKLVAIEPTDERKNGSVIWKCKCDCGNIIYARATELNRGKVRSCGCLKESRGSYKIRTILTNTNIDFISEKEFKTCIFTDTKAPARFDFYIPSKQILIEYDGEQHFKELDKKFFKDNLKTRQEHDLVKNKWCLNNGYSLYRIPYYEINNINSLEDILNDKFLIKKVQ